MDKSKYLFRQVRENDVPAIFELTRENDYHSDNLPQNADLILADVNRSVHDFTRVHMNAWWAKSLFIFVLEDADGGIVGVSLIKDVQYRLLYSLGREMRPAKGIVGSLVLRKECNVGELGGFLLSKNLRGKGLGKLLSYGRLLFLLCEELGPREVISGLMMTGVGMDDKSSNDFWDRVGIRATRGLSKADADTYWRSEGQLHRFFEYFPARISLAEDAGIILGDSAKSPLPIHPSAYPARHLLEKVGLRFMGEIEANGSVWYGASWQKVRRILMRHRVSSRRVVKDDCRSSCHADTAIVVTKEVNGFSACYMPIQIIQNGFVYVSRENARDTSLEHMFLF